MPGRCLDSSPEQTLKYSIIACPGTNPIKTLDRFSERLSGILRALSTALCLNHVENFTWILHRGYSDHNQNIFTNIPIGISESPLRGRIACLEVYEKVERNETEYTRNNSWPESSRKFSRINSLDTVRILLRLELRT